MTADQPAANMLQILPISLPDRFLGRESYLGRLTASHIAAGPRGSFGCHPRKFYNLGAISRTSCPNELITGAQQWTPRFASNPTKRDTYQEITNLTSFALSRNCAARSVRTMYLEYMLPPIEIDDFESHLVTSSPGDHACFSPRAAAPSRHRVPSFYETYHL